MKPPYKSIPNTQFFIKGLLLVQVLQHLRRCNPRQKEYVLERIEIFIGREVKQKKMSEWNGNAEAFKTYFHGKSDDDGKCVPAEKIKGMPGHSWEDVKNDENCGAVLNQDFIDISFDSKELSDAFWNMAADNDWESLIFENPKNKQIHSIWKKPKDWKFKDSQDVKLACGLIADLHGGSTFIRLKCSGVARFPPLYEPELIQEIPEELYPVNSSAEPFGMAEGGRNSVLSKMVTNFVYNTKFDREIIERIIFNTNKYIFSEPLPG